MVVRQDKINKRSEIKEKIAANTQFPDNLSTAEMRDFEIARKFTEHKEAND